METKPSLKSVLKRLRLSGILSTLPDRVAYARKAKLEMQDFLELILQDEIDRREQSNLRVRLQKARFTEEQTLEGFDWDAPTRSIGTASGSSSPWPSWRPTRT